MSLDFKLVQVEPVDVCEANVTHNLTAMADSLGIYTMLWHPEDCESINKASDIVVYLENALELLVLEPHKYKHLEADNGWGTIDWMTGFLDKVIKGCKEFPDAIIEVSV